RPYVELGAWRDVAMVVRAAHHYDLRDQPGQPWLELERRGDVGERAGRRQDDLVGSGAVRLDQELDGRTVARFRAGRRDVQVVAVYRGPARQGRGAWYREVRPGQRRRHAPVHRDVAADVVEDAERVLGGEVERDVAVDRGRPDQLKIGMQRRQHQRDGVVGPGVDVLDQLGARHGHRSRRPAAAATAWSSAAVI